MPLAYDRVLHDLNVHKVEYQLFGHPVLVMSLEDVIKAKKHAGRPKDLLHLITLEATLRLIKARKGKKPKV